MRCVYVVLLVALSGCPKKELKPRNPQPPSTSATGVITQVLRAGYDDGDAAKKGDKISIHFTGSLTDGGVFDTSYPRGAFEFWVGEGMVIPGLDEGLLGMKEGEARLITIPPAQGYGNDAKPGIPARSTLVFEVELLNVR